MKIADEALEPYWIEADNNNYTVQSEVMSGEGKFRVETLGYFSSIESAVLKIAKQKVLDDNPKYIITLKQYISEIKEIKNLIIKTVS